MKKYLALFTLLTFMTIPIQGALAWSYEGPNSLNPFTGFRQCNQCQKVVKVKCKKQKLTKCEKLNGVKIHKQQPTGCATPINMIQCPTCQKAF